MKIQDIRIPDDVRRFRHSKTDWGYKGPLRIHMVAPMSTPDAHRPGKIMICNGIIRLTDGELTIDDVLVRNAKEHDQIRRIPYYYILSIRDNKDRLIWVNKDFQNEERVSSRLKRAKKLADDLREMFLKGLTELIAERTSNRQAALERHLDALAAGLDAACRFARAVARLSRKHDFDVEDLRDVVREHALRRHVRDLPIGPDSEFANRIFGIVARL